MKILFTKIFDKEKVNERLGNRLSINFLEVIDIKNIKVKSFNLKNHSLIFTSINAVKAFFENGFQANENFITKDFNKIYAVGSHTKKELRKYNFGTFRLFKNSNELSNFIIDHCPYEKFLHFCGNLVLNTLEKKLSLEKIDYKTVTLYETGLLFPKVTEKYESLVFFSPSGVRSFVKNNTLKDSMIFSIGNATTDELKKWTNQDIRTSKDNTFEDLLNLISLEISNH